MVCINFSVEPFITADSHKYVWSFTDRLSRKYAIVAASGVFSIGILFEVIGANFGLLVAGRLVGGFGAGLMTK